MEEGFFSCIFPTLTMIRVDLGWLILIRDCFLVGLTDGSEARLVPPKKAAIDFNVISLAIGVRLNIADPRFS